MKPRWITLHSFGRIWIAIATIAVSSGILLLLRPSLSAAVIALLYLIPVVISAAAGGRVPGILASLLSFLTFNYLFIPPYYTFRVLHPQDLLAMLVLFGVAMLVSSLMTQSQSRLEQVQAREREAVQLSKLSLELASKRTEEDIAATLAEHLLEIFPTGRVEVETSHGDGKVSRTAHGKGYANSDHPIRQAQIRSARGLAGEIRIWGEDDQLSTQADRLLQTSVNQATLALERAFLADSEARARVLEESDRLKTAILSSVSHELRTPLASIQAAATSLFNPSVQLEQEARHELEVLLLEETEHLTQLVGNLLNMSRIEAGALKLQRQWNSLGEILDTSMHHLRRISSQHTIEVDVPDELPLVYVDPVLIEQVFLNLVRNSLKFAPPHTTICIQAETDEQAMRVTVSNQGPPIPVEQLDQIFEKFNVLAVGGPTQGIGLGLSICKGIIEGHGGRIWAANLPTGVAFTFTLPLTWQGVRPTLPDAEEEST